MTMTVDEGITFGLTNAEGDRLMVTMDIKSALRLREDLDAALLAWMQDHGLTREVLREERARRMAAGEVPAVKTRQ